MHIWSTLKCWQLHLFLKESINEVIQWRNNKKTYCTFTSVTAMSLVLNSIAMVIPWVMFPFWFIFWRTLANMSLCRDHWWMMRVWLLFLATPSAQLRRSLRNYRLLLKLRSRSMLPEKSIDLVGHDSWLKVTVYAFLWSFSPVCYSVPAKFLAHKFQPSLNNVYIIYTGLFYFCSCSCNVPVSFFSGHQG